MKDFSYSRALDAKAALTLFAENAESKFLGGGTNLIDLMREGIERPEALVDVSRIPLDKIEELPNGGVRIGALVRNSHLAGNAIIRDRYPVLSQAILAGASGQLRNMATTGGNVMQRTRCYYFYDNAARCNKRQPGSGCDAIDGFNRIHAILGASTQCVATHPSDMCVAMAALDAVVQVAGPMGDRAIPFLDFHRLPGETPNVETALESGELITSVDLPAMAFAKRSIYRKVRDRASYAFALVSVAAAIEIEGNRVTHIQIAMGGVAHKPWRARTAEEVLRGAPADVDNFTKAAEAELKGAVGLTHNSFKIELAKRVMVNVLQELAEQPGGAA